MTNWILTKKIELTTIDKLKELLKHSYKLVLVQQHELENQLEDCVKQAKYLYLRGLNNETQRISSAAPARSSR